MTICVISQCTKRKLKASAPVRADQLYTGQWHKYVMAGVEASGADLYIVSAKHGLVPADAMLMPYERTFQGMGVRRIEVEGIKLGVNRDIRQLLEKPYELFVFAMSKDYLRACSLPRSGFGGKAMVFTADPSLVPPVFKVIKVGNDAATLRRLGCNKISAGARAVELFLKDRVVS